ncbi:stage III sporulation protein AF [Ruminiclostridium josui]|uniref:stage III sporulation protein AF n=1 Tax=Ruminiclostridium josui TaxID=1499 RepID=UPI00046742C5|nr:stage III sporulation protein AF [Ruminiclostridium josui]
MLEFLKSWIINIVTITIILILFEIIMPSGKIKKVISLIAGFILLIAVINPFLALKNKNFDLGQNVISDSMYIDKNELEASSKLLKDKQMKQVSQVYKEKVINSIQEQALKVDGVSQAKADIEINEDYSSDKFGEITRVNLQVKRGKKKSDSVKIISVMPVEKVDISLPFIKGKKNNKTVEAPVDEESKKITEQLRQTINKSFEIKKDNIIVTVN